MAGTYQWLLEVFKPITMSQCHRQHLPLQRGHSRGAEGLGLGGQEKAQLEGGSFVAWPQHTGLEPSGLPDNLQAFCRMFPPSLFLRKGNILNF